MAVQVELRGQLEIEDRLPALHRVAGVDVGFEDRGRITRAAVVVVSYPELECVDRALARTPTRFPYVPGLLAFRELPAVIEALQRLTVEPQLFLCDGQGLAHPRRFGIACHLGLLTHTPALGVGKSRLLGQHADVGNARGAWQPLIDNHETIGAVLRTRTGVKPVYVSPGHRIDQRSAIELVLATAPRFRLPEPIRQADKLASSGKLPGKP